MVDHVKQYKIPREYMETEEDKKKRKKKKNEDDDEESSGEESDNPEYEGLSMEEITELKWKKRLYKPTGPDGAGWGDFRKLNAGDLEVLAEFQRMEEKERKRQMKLEAMKELKGASSL